MSDQKFENAAVEGHLTATFSGATAEERKAGAEALAGIVKAEGVRAFTVYKMNDKMTEGIQHKKDAVQVEGALELLLATAGTGQEAEPHILSALPLIFECFGHKEATVRELAQKTTDAALEMMSPYAVGFVLPLIFKVLDESRKWQAKEAALKFIGSLVGTNKQAQLSAAMPDMVPQLVNYLQDTKKQVADACNEAFLKVCGSVGNRDIEPYAPILASALGNPSEVPDAIHKLSATTFVQNVEAPALAVMAPILQRGLQDRTLAQTAIKRKSAVITDNMCKLVEDPVHAQPFLPKLLPLLKKNSEDVADPEARNVTIKATKMLLQVAEVNEDQAAAMSEEARADVVRMEEELKELIGTFTIGKAHPESYYQGLGVQTDVKFVAAVCAGCVDTKQFDQDVWTQQCIMPYLKSFLPTQAIEKTSEAYFARFKRETIKTEFVDDDEEGEELCNCTFKLAYGGLILLNNATLRLKRGKRYGLCGPNGVGKTTLMRAIYNGQLDGFPPRDQVRTIFVEHDIQGNQTEMTVRAFIIETLGKMDCEVDEAEVISVLESVGFANTDSGVATSGTASQSAPVGTLSGGWKMKLALARAMLYKADILLLDEPTNHLDVKNVAWLQNYLCNVPNVTSIQVSHDSGFLDAVCTHIVHYENRKLRKYKGNLSEFVKQCPEAKSYYELSSNILKFTFPDPGFLEGVKNKDKAILKMSNVDFAYPGTTRQILHNITVQCSLSSRVACVGPNGAGKSTLIKVLTGELEPNVGEVWKHPNLRIAYVAQHAFHHIEQHLEKTPNEYIQWRYAGGEDKENLEKTFRKLTPEEEAALQEKVMCNGKKRVLEKIVSRRKLKQSFEYEVHWEDTPEFETHWLPRQGLTDMGFGKIVQQFDEKEASALGVVKKPLTKAKVEAHLGQFGLDPEFATHSQMRGLSGGQKVKVVLAAAMWDDPQMVVLDEPTNYLDRDSLGALADAIKEYGGGVLVISHNNEFCKTVCPEVWEVSNGVAKISEGDDIPLWLKGKGKKADREARKAEKVEFKEQADTIIDALGNEVKVKAPKKKLSRKEMKQKAKLKAARRERGEEVSDSEDDL